METTEARQLLARLAELYEKCGPNEPWRIEQEPHDYPDGTTHFTHVRKTGYVMGEPVLVTITRYATPELAALLVLMRNNLPELIHLARVGLTAAEDHDQR